MGNPTLSDVHVNVPLSNLSIAFMQEQENFIADKVFPILPVRNQSDRYYVYNRDAWFRSDAEERAPGTESVGTGFTIDNTPTYYARVYSVHDDVADQVRANSDSVLQPDADATDLVTQQLLIQRENKWINTFFRTGLWTANPGGDLTGVLGTPTSNQFKQWDQAGSTPIEDVRTQGLNMAQLTGKKPNTLLLGPYVGLRLVNNPEIVDRVKYTQLGFLDYSLLAQAFGVERVLVPLGTQNTAVENAPLSMNFLYGKSAFLCYSERNPGLKKASAGYIFGWQGYLNGTASVAVSKFRMQHLKSDRIEGETAYDMKVVSTDLGAFFTTCVS